MSRHMVIVNPASGRGAGGRSVPAIERTLAEYGLQYALEQTERPWHAAELARQAARDGYDTVVAAGGDGTVNEVLNGLMAARDAGEADGVAMGTLCVGQGNDFAFGAGIPTGVAEGCRVLAQGHQCNIDVGRAVGGDYPAGRYFANGVGIGFDAVVGFEALKMTRLQGFVSYLVAALKTIFLYYQAPLVRVEYDGQVTTLPALMVSVMNGRRMGGGFLMAPQGCPDDGLLDVCIVNQVSRPRILALIVRFLQGTQGTHPAVLTGLTRHISVTAIRGALPAHADGETLCVEGQHLEIEVVPGGVGLVCDAAHTSS